MVPTSRHDIVAKKMAKGNPTTTALQLPLGSMEAFAPERGNSKCYREGLKQYFLANGVARTK